MKRCAMHAALLTLLLAATNGPPPALALEDDDPGPLSGHWVGAFEGDYGGGGAVCLDLFAQRNRRYDGRIALSLQPGDPCQPIDPCRLVISASGRVSLLSHNSTQAIQAHGYLDGGMLVLRYHVNSRSGVQDRGVMLLELGD